MQKIKELKESIGQAAEQIISAGVPLRRKGSKYHCPNVSSHRNGDRTPSMSWDKTRLQFYCFACNEVIDIYKYYREYENLSHSEIMEKIEVGLSTKFTNELSLSSENEPVSFEYEPLSDKQHSYLEERGLTRETIDYFLMSNNDGNISIPYFDKEKNLTGVKIKNLKGNNPKYLAQKGSKFGLLNRHNISTKEPLIITEGEFDCMIVHQAGYSNVASIGTGANSLEGLLTIEKDFFFQVDSIIVLSDNDSSGENMKQIFTNKFGAKIKTPDISLFNGLKDINEVYLKLGENQVKEIIESATLKIEGLRDVDKKPYKGVSKLEGKYIATGLPSIDYAINDLMPGTLCLITGRSNGGKSTFINQIIGNAIENDNSVLLLNGEGNSEFLLNKLYESIIGNEKEYYSEKLINKRTFKEPKPHILPALQEWHKNKLTMFNKGDSRLKTINEIHQLIDEQVRAKKFDLVVLDNLMSLISIEKASEKWDQQADFVQNLSNLAKIYNITIVLALHPVKELKKGQRMDFEQISGSSDIYNKADTIISVTRIYDDNMIALGINGEIEVLKNRYFPNLEKVETHFDIQTGVIMEFDRVNRVCHKYNFDWKRYLNKGF